MIAPRDIHWLAGLLEGEGWFGLGRRGKPMGVNVSMTDQDVVERAACILGARVYRKGRTGRPNELPIFAAGIWGSAMAAGWMMTLYSEMGARRRARIRACLAEWRARPVSAASVKRTYYRLAAAPLCEHGGSNRYVKRNAQGRILGSHCRDCHNARRRRQRRPWHGLSGRKAAMAQRLPTEAWEHLVARRAA